MDDTEKPMEDNRPTESVKDVIQTNQEDVHPTELSEPIKNNVDPNEQISKDTITDVIGQELIANPIASTGYIVNGTEDSKSFDLPQAPAMPENEIISPKPNSDDGVKKDDSYKLDVGITPSEGVQVNDSLQLEVDTNPSEDVFKKKVNDKTSASPKDESKADKKRKTSVHTTKSSKKKETAIETIKESIVEAADANIEPKIEENIFHEVPKEEKLYQALDETKVNHELVQSLQAGTEEPVSEKTAELTPTLEENTIENAPESNIIKNVVIDNASSEDTIVLINSDTKPAEEKKAETQAHEETKVTKTKGKDSKAKDFRKKVEKAEAKVETLEVKQDQTNSEANTTETKTLEKTELESQGLDGTKASDDNHYKLALPTGTEIVPDPDVGEPKPDLQGAKILDTSEEKEVPIGEIASNIAELSKREKIDKTLEVDNKPLEVPKEEIANLPSELPTDKKEENKPQEILNKDKVDNKPSEVPKEDNKPLEVPKEGKADTLEVTKEDNKALEEPKEEIAETLEVPKKEASQT